MNAPRLALALTADVCSQSVLQNQVVLTPSATRSPAGVITTAVAAACAILVGTTGTAAAAELRVTVTPDQKVTVVGRFDSLRELLAEICSKAQVELRSYDAPDHAVGANYDNRPLSEVLERMLASENYLLGVTGGGNLDDPVRVAWIRVTGLGSAGVRPMSGGVRVPVDFGAADFGKEDSSQSTRALEAITKHLLADEATITQFLKIAPKALAQSLRQYPHVGKLLAKLRTQQRNPEVAAKLDAVIAELAKDGPEQAN